MGRYTKKVKAGAQARAGENHARILAIDYGKVRIGLAMAGVAARIAEPMGTLQRINRNEDMRRLRELTREHSVTGIVIGLPLNLDGTRGAMAKEVERFAKRVRKQIGVPVALVDERLTSWEAGRVMEEEFGKRMRSRSEPRGKKEEKVTVDSVAAVVILREYLAGAKAHLVEIGDFQKEESHS
jgi:putative holliday junction resolvase